MSDGYATTNLTWEEWEKFIKPMPPSTDHPDLYSQTHESITNLFHNPRPRALYGMESPEAAAQERKTGKPSRCGHESELERLRHEIAVLSGRLEKLEEGRS